MSEPETPRIDLSIVVPHYGNADDTAALVAQLVRPSDDAFPAGGPAGEVEPSIEIVLVDDSSPEPLDGSRWHDPRVRLLRRDENGGFGAAVNTGARAATGELLLVLNSDLVLPPGFLRTLVGLARPLMPAIVGPALVATDGAPAHSARRFPRAHHQVVEWLTPLARVRETEAWHRAVGHTVVSSDETLVAVDWMVGACLLLPRATFLELGGFDERFHMNSEEVDLQWRAAQRGVPRFWLPGVRLTHVGGASSDPLRRRGWLVTSRNEYADKWQRGGRRPLQVALTAATAANLAVNSVRRVRNREVAPLATARTELDLIWKDHR